MNLRWFRRLPNEELLRQSRVVIIDDEPSNVVLLERILAWGEFHNFRSFCDPVEALRACTIELPDLVLLDLNMPVMDGFQVLSALRQTAGSQYLPIVVLTADVNSQTRTRALTLGASDFLTKPGEATEIVLRVRNLLETKLLHRQLKQHNCELDALVRKRTGDLDKARLEALERLARAAEFRDDDTGQHANRVGTVSAQIARTLGESDTEAAVIELAAPLHDIGKIGIPDSILLKPGKLTPEEFDVMKTHTTIGAKILGGSDSPVLKEATAIALNHHEKWNGAGYPNGIPGEQIPLSGRIVAVADVFDALTHERPYKRAWTQEAAIEHIQRLSGLEFDPAVVAAFSGLVECSNLAEAA
jgi:putative two-component system response regulator